MQRVDYRHPHAALARALYALMPALSSGELDRHYDKAACRRRNAGDYGTLEAIVYGMLDRELNRRIDCGLVATLTIE